MREEREGRCAEIFVALLYRQSNASTPGPGFTEEGGRVCEKVKKSGGMMKDFL